MINGEVVESVEGNFNSIAELIDIVKSWGATVEFANMDKEFRDALVEYIERPSFMPDYMLMNNLELLKYDGEKRVYEEIWLWDDCNTCYVTSENSKHAETMFNTVWLAKATRSRDGWNITINKNKHREE